MRTPVVLAVSVTALGLGWLAHPPHHPDRCQAYRTDTHTLAEQATTDQAAHRFAKVREDETVLFTLISHNRCASELEQAQAQTWLSTH